MTTTAIQSNLPVLVVIAPLFLAFVLPSFARRIRLVESLVIAVQTMILVGAAFLAVQVLGQAGNSIVYGVGGWAAPWGIELLEGNLGTFFLLVVASVSLPIALYACTSIAKEVGGPERSTWFLVLYLLLSGVLTGIAITNDLFNMFVLIEVATLSSVGLVSARRGPKAAKAAFHYLILATLASVFILGAIGLFYIITGYLNMGFASQELNKTWQNYPHVVWMAISLVLVGFAVKSALFPLHVWLPDAHSTAPSPASAMLSGLAVKGYIICLIKVLYIVLGTSLMRVFFLDHILTSLGMIAILAGSIFALQQDEIKRRLAFSTVAQVGYLFLGLGLLNATGLKGTLFYLGSHALIKSTLFLSAGAIISKTGKHRISELAGVGKKMPVTMGVFTVASLGLVGIPLFSGFVGKWYMLLGSLEIGGSVAAGVIITGSILCAAYLFPIVRIAYFEPAPQTNLQDPEFLPKAILVAMAIGIVVLGVMPGPFLELATRAAADLLATI